MNTCKFCGIAEGAPDRRGNEAHINRDSLCAPCNYVIERIRRQPDKVKPEDYEWFVDMCTFNEKVGMYVPRFEARRRFVWKCAKCGRTTAQDRYYKKYCALCADIVRRHARIGKRKTRSDKGQKHDKKKEVK